MNKTLGMIVFLMAAGVMLLPCKANAGCESAPSVAKVTVRQVGNIPVYEFKVVNSQDEPIAGLDIRLALDTEQTANEANLIPTKIISPLGWKWSQVKKDGRMQYQWDSYGSHYDIAPGGTLSGFRLVMPAQLDISSLCAMVYCVTDEGHLTYGCAAGSVIVEK